MSLKVLDGRILIRFLSYLLGENRRDESRRKLQRDTKRQFPIMSTSVLKRIRGIFYLKRNATKAREATQKSPTLFIILCKTFTRRLFQRRKRKSTYGTGKLFMFSANVPTKLSQSRSRAFLMPFPLPPTSLIRETVPFSEPRQTGPLSSSD